MIDWIGPAVAGAVLLSASALAAQDWQDAITKACEHRRFALRRAAANKVAGGGDAAIPALERYLASHLDTVVPLVLVEAIARSDAGGPKTVALLARWAMAPDFYWRAHALGGLAQRELPQFHDQFTAATQDPSHLFRIAGARGLYLLDPIAAAGVVHGLVDSDPDPRARVRLAAFLAERGDPHGLPLLIAALDLRNEFLGNPWGTRAARTALRALVAVTGDDFGYDLAADAQTNADARARFVTALSPRTETLRPVELTALDRTFVGGIEIRSCRHGDLFVRWTADGEIAAGLLPASTITLSPKDWTRLRYISEPLQRRDSAVFGKVVCDYLQLQNGPHHRWKSAPGALPDEQRQWLENLANTIGHTPGTPLAEEIRGRLPQFASGPEGK